jgi:hypothetical protein
MTRTRLAAAAVLTIGLLAPVAAASSASAAPQTCSDQVLVKDHKINKGKAKKVGHSKPAFVHAGRVSSVDAAAGTVSFVVRGGQNKALRGCVLTVVVTADTKLLRNGVVATVAELGAGDHVNVKGTSAKDATTSEVTYTAKRIAAAGAKA